MSPDGPLLCHDASISKVAERCPPSGFEPVIVDVGICSDRPIYIRVQADDHYGPLWPQADSGCDTCDACRWRNGRWHEQALANRVRVWLRLRSPTNY